MEAFYHAALPFALTGAQRRAIDPGPLEDFREGTPMNRLVQGDVGSGKTMVAAGAVYCAAKNRVQSALMAPTEILGRAALRVPVPALCPYGHPGGAADPGSG